MKRKFCIYPSLIGKKDEYSNFLKKGIYRHHGRMVSPVHIAGRLLAAELRGKRFGLLRRNGGRCFASP